MSWDGAAVDAGQRHVNVMVAHGFTAELDLGDLPGEGFDGEGCGAFGLVVDQDVDATLEAESIVDEPEDARRHIQIRINETVEGRVW